MKNNYDDEKCRSNFTTQGDRYTMSKINNAAKGAWDPDIPVNCELETPYKNYADDNWCPFPLPAAENEFFSERTDTRDSVSLWNYMYNKINNSGSLSDCSYECVDSTCTDEEYGYIDTCKDIKQKFNNDSSNNKNVCEEKFLANGRHCKYYPENVPLQMRLQNQERYLIVNQEYDQNLFS